MKELSSFEYYNYIKKIILLTKNTNQNVYYFNNQLLKTIEYNKYLDCELGLKMMKQLSNHFFQEQPLYNMDFKYYGKKDIDPIKILISNEQYICVKKAFNILPNALKEIIDLHLFQRKKFYDIADQLKNTMFNIQRDYYFGLAMLKHYYIYYYQIEKTIYCVSY